MSEQTGLSIVIEPVNALAVFTQPDHIEQILQQVEAEVSAFVFDVSTKKGRDALASLGLKVAKTKTYLDGLGKDLVTEYKEVPKKIDASRKVVRDRLDALKEKVLLPKIEWEAEQERIKAEDEARLAAETYSAMRDEADRLNADFDKAAATALAARVEADHELALLMNEKHDRDAAEAAAEKERQRLAHEEMLKEQARLAAEAKAKADIAAAEQAAAEAKAALEWAEKQAAQAAAEAEKSRVEALQRAELEKAEAIAAEQRKAAAVEAARIAAEKQAAAEAAKRAADVENRRKVNQAILAALMSEGIPENHAKTCIKVIASGIAPGAHIIY